MSTDGTPQFPPRNASSSSFHREEGFSGASPEVGTKPFFGINIIKGGPNHLLCATHVIKPGQHGVTTFHSEGEGTLRESPRGQEQASPMKPYFLHREPSPGCLPFPQIDLRVKTCFKPPRTAYCGSGMQGGEESERQSLIKTHQGEIKSPL